MNAGGDTVSQLEAIKIYNSSDNDTTYQRFLRAQEMGIRFKKFAQFLQKNNEVKGDKSNPSNAEIDKAIELMGWKEYKKQIKYAYKGK